MESAAHALWAFPAAVRTGGGEAQGMHAQLKLPVLRAPWTWEGKLSPLTPRPPRP